MISHEHDSFRLVSLLFELLSQIDAFIIIVDNAVEFAIVEHRVVESAAILVNLAKFIVTGLGRGQNRGVRLMCVEHSQSAFWTKTSMDLTMNLDGRNIGKVCVTVERVVGTSRWS